MPYKPTIIINNGSYWNIYLYTYIIKIVYILEFCQYIFRVGWSLQIILYHEWKLFTSPQGKTIMKITIRWVKIVWTGIELPICENKQRKKGRQTFYNHLQTQIYVFMYTMFIYIYNDTSKRRCGTSSMSPIKMFL